VSPNESDFQMETMQDLICLAKTWRGKTGHNPTVAAAVVVDNVVIAQGVHRGDGTSHAEIDAILQAGDKCKGAELYVTLEPCTHHGKTPPCVEAIQRAGFSKVVYAIEDPNPDVRSKGGAKKILIDAGIEVQSGVCESEAYELNKEFFFTMKTGKPYVVLKIAQSFNGKIPLGENGKAQMISGEPFLKFVHELRGRCDVILTGIGTISADDPKFDVRYGLKEKGFKDPALVILDPSGKCSEKARVFESDRDVFIFVDKDKCDVGAMSQKYPAAHCVALSAHEGAFDWDLVVSKLDELGFRHILVEAGPKTMSWAKEHVQETILGVSFVTLNANAIDSPLNWRECWLGFSGCLVGEDIILRKIDA